MRSPHRALVLSAPLALRSELQAKATAEGRSPTEVYAFSELESPVRMFFLEDPDGLRVEMIEDHV